MLSRLKARLHWLFRKSHAEKELEAEVLDHLERQAGQNLRFGMNAEEARVAARKAFGGVEQAKEQSRDIHGLRWLEEFWKDLRYGARMLMKNPGFAWVVICTLALGLGINTAIFTIFDAFMLKPLPLKDPESIVKLEGRLRNGKSTRLFSYLEYLEYRDRIQVFDGLIAWNQVAGVFGEKPLAPINDVLHVSKEFELIIGKIVSGNYFSVLGAEMALGRGFLPEEDRTPGVSSVIVLSYGFWQRRFDSDLNLLGKTIKLSGQPYTVVGVTSREFIGTEPNTSQFWIPLMMRDQAIQAGDWHHLRWLTDRDADAFVLTGRLKHGVSHEQALAETNVIAAQIAQSYPDQPLQTEGAKEYILVRTEGDPGPAMAGVRGEAEAVHPNFSVSLRRVSDSLAIQLAPFEALAQAAGALGMLALLLASVGLYGVMSFTVHQRTREIGVRVALGAKTADIIHLFLIQGMRLTLIGILIGLLGAAFISRLLAAVLVDLSPVDPLAFGGVAVFLSIIALTACYLPARRATKLNTAEALRDN
jgi:hypothetical protein